jgi:hypothetical protein
MSSFIDSVQKYLSENCKDLQKVEIVVPNNRTGAALLASMKKNAKEVCWAPKITPIKQIFVRGTKLHEADSVILVYMLYKAYMQFETPDSKTTFDNFYNFGEVMLSDFDDIDKYLVNPQKLFSNIAEEKEIDIKFADMEDSMVEILQSFWKNVSRDSVLDNKLKSLELWKKMPDIYAKFTADIRQRGIGYQGFIYRDFVENRMMTTSFDSENYAFVGFSALNKCEKSLFAHIRNVTKEKNGQCLFFWDADKYYTTTQNQEAGLFLRSDLKEFPLPEGFELSDTIRDLYKRDIQVIEVPTSVAQVKLIPELLKEYENVDGKTAIILGDEKLLVPLIYSLPQTFENASGEESPLTYNITMGYPLSYTASASFVQIIMKLAAHRSVNKTQNTTYLNRKDIFSAIMHSFTRKHVKNTMLDKINEIIAQSKIDYVNIECIREIAESNELLKLLFDVEKMGESFPRYILSVCQYVYENILAGINETESDFMHKIITLYMSFLNALGDDIVFDKDNMYSKLMTSMIKQSNIAFEGKSDNKMQILGFMETRSLDFDNIIMLSMNEDTFPKSSYKKSLIPYNLRKAFSMPSIEFQNSIFAYYFYRLLQRSKTIRILYHTEGKISHAEKSRFVTQIEYELMDFNDVIANKQKYHTTKSYEVRPSQTPPLEIAKTDAKMQKIHRLLGCDNGLMGVFPKMINTYISCPVGFYFEYIEGLREEPGIDDDTSALDFGNLLHESCHFLYRDYIGKEINVGDFVGIKANIENAIDYAVKKVFTGDSDDEALFNEAKMSIMIMPLRKYLERIVATDEKYAPFMIVDLENEKLRKKFGSLLHKSRMMLYKDCIGKLVDKNDFVGIKANIGKVVESVAIDAENGAKTDIMLKQLRKSLSLIVANDDKNAPLEIAEWDEDDIRKNSKNCNYTIEYKVGEKTVQLKGIIDRIDLKNGRLRVIDYKTSMISDSKKLYDDKFWDTEEFKSKEALQVLVYSEIMSQLMPEYEVQPCIISVTGHGDYNLKYKTEEDEKKDIENYKCPDIGLRDDFNDNLKRILGELLNKNTNFRQTENSNNCAFCSYNKICNRKNK